VNIGNPTASEHILFFKNTAEAEQDIVQYAVVWLDSKSWVKIPKLLIDGIFA